MPFSSSPFPQSGRRTFRAACVVLTGVALAQGLALGMVWKENRKRPVSAASPGEAPATGEQAAKAHALETAHISPSKPDHAEAPAPAPAALNTEQTAVPKAVEPDPFASPVPPADDLAGDPSFPSDAKQKVSSVAGPGAAVLAQPSIKPAAPLDIPITNEECLRHLDEGIYLRGRGEMQGALAELRAALACDPDHPQLLYQLARTLDIMLQERKSVVLWEKLRKLGPGAGNSYQLAVNRLRELSGVTPAAADEDEEEKGGRFELGPVAVERLADTSNGEILRFHASVKRLQSDPVDVAKIWIKLHLFDMVNGQRIERTTAVPAVPQWPDNPVDWAEGVERFDFEYRQAPLTADEIVKLGQRKYYGYAVELRYGEEHQEKFEDMVAEPRELANFAREIPEGGPSPAEPAITPAQGGRQSAPDGTLFPGDRFDR